MTLSDLSAVFPNLESYFKKFNITPPTDLVKPGKLGVSRRVQITPDLCVKFKDLKKHISQLRERELASCTAKDQRKNVKKISKSLDVSIELAQKGF